MIKKLKRILKEIYYNQKEILIIEKINRNINRSAVLSALRNLDETNPSSWEFSGFSQNGEDGIIDFLSSKIKKPNYYFTEIGASDGLENNCSFLAIVRKNQGLMIDGNRNSTDICKHYICKNNIGCDVLNLFVCKTNISHIVQKMIYKNADVFSIDIDGIDYYILKEILKQIRPKIIIVEYNSAYGPNKSITVKYKENFNLITAHKTQLYYGVSISAWKKLMNLNDYHFVTVDKNGVNAIFIDKKEFDNSFYSNLNGFDFRENFYQMNKFRVDWKTQYEMIKNMEFYNV